MAHTADRTPRKLEALDDYELEHKEQDIRGQTLVTPDGTAIGRIDDMLVDRDRERIAALRLDDDRIVDVDHVDIRDGKPVLLVPHDRLPRPEGKLDRDNITTEHIPIIEERLEVGKRQVETGGVRIRKRVVEEPVRENVTLREEHVDVERRPVNERIDGDEARALFKDRDIEMTETSEKVVAAKEAVVTDEVVVSKDTNTRTEQVDDTVRHTEVDVDRKPGDRR